MDKRIIVTAAVTFLLLMGVLIALLMFKNMPFTKYRGQLVCQDCNIILITMTNLRYDHMSFNGYSRPTTPNLDKLAKESLVFDNAFAHASWTLPDAISIYTSLYPMEHGVMNRYDGSTLPNTTDTLVDIVNKGGFQSAAFTGGFDYNPEFGLTNRFQTYEKCTKGHLPTKGASVGGPSEYGEFNCTIPKAIEWIKASSGQKFFLHVQGFDAHCPFSQKGGKMYDKDYKGMIDYSDCLWTFDRTESKIIDGKTYYSVYQSSATPDLQQVLLGPEDIKHLIAIYDESITFADSEIGNLLDELKRLEVLDNTIIIFTSEHGDMFGKQGRFMRGGPLRGTFYDDVLHVPLFIRHPSFKPRKIEGLVSHVDLMPTILELLGLSSPTRMSGRSLLPLINDGREVNDYVFAGSQFTPSIINPYFNKKTRIFSIRSDKWKLISETAFEEDGSSFESIELYDVENDKEELHNLKDEKQDVLRTLQESLNRWLRSTEK